jgi:hypothetical protein
MRLAMTYAAQQRYAAEHSSNRDSGLNNDERNITSPQTPEKTLADGRRDQK